MPTYRVRIVRTVQTVREVTVTADSDDYQDLQPAINAADESEFTTVSTNILDEQNLDVVTVPPA